MCVDIEAVSSMQAAGWPVCVANGRLHQPSLLSLAQIIPANGMACVCVGGVGRGEGAWITSRSLFAYLKIDLVEYILLISHFIHFQLI